jgi:hypothetical protein
MILTMLGVLILLPLLGFLANGSIAFFGKRSDGDSASTARHPLVTVIGPGVILAAFGVAVTLFLDMQRAPEQALHIVRYGQWMPVGNLVIDWSICLFIINPVDNALPRSPAFFNCKVSKSKIFCSPSHSSLAIVATTFIIRDQDFLFGAYNILVNDLRHLLLQNM